MVVVLTYKHLWMVEAIFRSMKSLLDTRPVYHKYDATIRGHMFCSFLALLLRKELETGLARKQWRLEWRDIVRDLDRLQETHLQVKDTAYAVRSHATGVTGKLFQACGVALPPVVHPCRQPPWSSPAVPLHNLCPRNLLNPQDFTFQTVEDRPSRHSSSVSATFACASGVRYAVSMGEGQGTGRCRRR